VLDHNRTIYTRPQVYCKEYPGLVGIEGLTKTSDPIDDDGKILEYKVLHEKRMQGDRELRDRDSRLPGDRQEPDSGDDEDYWPTENPIERPQTRQLVKERDARANLVQLSSEISVFLVLEAVALPATPKSMEEALSGPDAEHWRKGRDKELKGISDRSTWSLVESKKRIRKKPVTSKWAFRVSWEPDGTIKYRCRIVARGFFQVPGADFDLTYAPTLQLKRH
jgi:hypothetical protein